MALGNNQNEVSYSLGLDTSAFKEGLGQAQADLQAMQQAVQRMNAEQAQQPTASSLPPGAVAPPLPPPPPVNQDPAQKGGEESSPIARAWAEIERIKTVSSVSPDVAMLQLQGNQGRGGLLSQAMRGAASAQTPEEQQAYGELLKALKDLSGNIQKQSSETEKRDPATSMLNLLRSDMLIRTGTGIAGQFADGNLLGGMTSTAGAGIGMLLGGPAGAAAGSQIGQMLGGLLAPFTGGFTQSEQRMLERSDMSARFGDRAVADQLSVASLSGMNTSGYDVDETSRLFDQLRQQNVIDTVGEGEKELVENIQGLTRALGLNTDAVVGSYANYRQQGGEQDVNAFMQTQLSGAIASGMKENFDQYLELTSSSSRQLVATNFSQDVDGGGMRGVQQALAGLVGQNNRTGDLLRDNPGMAQQMMSGLLATGTTNEQFGMQASMMRAAGIEGNQILAGFTTPEEQAENALQQASFVNQRFFQSAGLNQEDLAARAKVNPNFVADELLQSESAQTHLNEIIAQQFHGGNTTAVTAEERARTMQLMQLQLTNGGLSVDMPLGEGQSMTELLNGPKSDAQVLRETVETFQGSMDELGEIFQPFMSEIRELLPPLIGGVVEGLREVTEELGPELSREWGELKPVLKDQLIPAISDVAGLIAKILGSNVVQGMIGIAEAGNAGGGNAAMTALNIAGGAAEGVMGVTPVGMVMNQTRRAGGAIRDFIFGRGEEAAPATGGEGVGMSPADVANNRAMSASVRREVDAAFNDTPDSGILATQEYNTFQFAPGDRVYASQGGGGGRGGSSFNASIIVELAVPPGADMPWVQDAAARGTQAGFDEFVAKWQSRNTDPVQLYQTDY